MKDVVKRAKTAFHRMCLPVGAKQPAAVVVTVVVVDSRAVKVAMIFGLPAASSVGNLGFPTLRVLEKGVEGWNDGALQACKKESDAKN